MTRVALAASLILLIGLAHEEPVGAQDIARLQAGVVKITSKPPQGTANVGTGFIVRVDKDAAYVVTAAHVVAGDQQPKVEFFTKRNMPVTADVLGLEGDDEVRGLALLMVKGAQNLPNDLTALSLAGAAVTGGEDVMAIGFPRSAGPWAVVKGNISSRKGRDIFFSPSLDSGHSGGPIIQAGKVVAVVGSAGQSVGRGVIVRSVQDYIEGFGITAQESMGSSPSAASVPTPPPPAITAKPESQPLPQAREITGKDGAPMVLVPPGEFWMGSPDNEGGGNEHPRHSVALSAFSLDKYEVTNRRFEQFVRETSYNWRQPEGGETVFASKRDDHPVVFVSWDDAQAYCRWAGSKRLPTEAEFEYAMRAGTETMYWWGNERPKSRRVGNFADESLRRKNEFTQIIYGYDDGYVGTAPVGSFEANQFGLHDMSGNVEEWTADWYDKTYNSTSPPRNPKGPSSGEYRVIRGGSWYSGPVNVRSAYRNSYTPTERNDHIGFRCAQDVPK